MASKPKTYKPGDWLKGSTTIGKQYTAWDTYGQGKPDFGAAQGPGDPYHEVQKTVRRPVKPPKWVPPKTLPQAPGRPSERSWIPPGTISTGHSDPRISVIRRRLGWA